MSLMKRDFGDLKSLTTKLLTVYLKLFQSCNQKGDTENLLPMAAIITSLQTKNKQTFSLLSFVFLVCHMFVFFVFSVWSFVTFITFITFITLSIVSWQFILNSLMNLNKNIFIRQWMSTYMLALQETRPTTKTIGSRNSSHHFLCHCHCSVASDGIVLHNKSGKSWLSHFILKKKENMATSSKCYTASKIKVHTFDKVIHCCYQRFQGSLTSFTSPICTCITRSVLFWLRFWLTNSDWSEHKDTTHIELNIEQVTVYFILSYQPFWSILVFLLRLWFHVFETNDFLVSLEACHIPQMDKSFLVSSYPLLPCMKRKLSL